jgi:hypothetical protein
MDNGLTGKFALFFKGKENMENEFELYRVEINDHVFDIPVDKNGRKNWIDSIKLSKRCAICGYARCPEALHLHHIYKKNNKNESIGLLKRTGSNQELKEELRKCVVLCANCHTEFHHGYLK